MDIESIRNFYKLTRLKSISRLAETSNISQPALSQHLQRLEAEVGHTLFTRSNRGIELTDAGKIMKKYARSYVALYENMTQDFEALKSGRTVLRIFCTGGIGPDKVVEMIAGLRRQFSQLLVVKSFSDPDEVWQSLKSRECGIGILPFAGQQDSGFVYVPLYTENLLLLTDRKSPAPDRIWAGAIPDHPLYLLHEDHYLSKPVHNYFQEHRLADHLNVACVFDDIRTVKEALIYSGGLAFLPEACVKNELAAGILRQVGLEGFQHSETVYFVADSKLRKDRNTARLFKHLSEQAAQLYTI